MRSVVRAAAVIAILGLASVRGDAACGGSYTVEAGESLSSIADKLYKNAGLWTVLYAANRAEIGPVPTGIRVGQQLRVPCRDGGPVGLDAGIAAVEAPVQAVSQDRPVNADPLRVLAADGFAPFTDRGLAGAGMLAEILSGALEGAGDHRVYWINDRAAHLEPMLSDGLADLAFPWQASASAGPRGLRSTLRTTNRPRALCGPDRPRVALHG